MAKRHLTPYHQTLLDRIGSVAKCPADQASFDTWIMAGSHLKVLAQNSKEDELIVYAVANSFFVDTAIVPRAKLKHVDPTDLLQWSSDPGPGVGYSTSLDGPDTINRVTSFRGSKLLEAATRLVYRRKFVGLKTDDSDYIEASQEYLHLSDCHWRPERGAYCRFDENGDFDPIISVSVQNAGVTLVSFSREPLEEYLAGSDSLLVRLFDFTLTRPDRFDRWPDSAPWKVRDSNPELVFKQRIFPGFGSRARGYQFVHLSPSDQVWARQRERWSGRGAEKGVEFWAHDERNGTITKISTRRGATADCSNAGETKLPFETSRAFFRAEVLHKYTADPDKYTVEDRGVHCRGAWELRAHGVNDAGQVFAHICDLRDLPDQEQVYWQSFNEKPKAGLPDDLVRPDFSGMRPPKNPPLPGVEYVLHGWNQEGRSWWKVRNQSVLDALRVPRGDSSQEWARAFQALTTAVVEGFHVRPIRRLLAERGIELREEDRSITLLEKAIDAAGITGTGRDSVRLKGLREAQTIRNKVAAHAGGSVAETLKRNALRDYGTFAGHFEAVCGRIANELADVEDALKLLSQA